MKKFLGLMASALLLLPLLSGCEGTLPMPKPDPVKADIMGSSHKAADVLLDAATSLLERGKPVIVASFVNINNLDSSSSFGRVVSRQVGSRFTERGVKVIEMLLRHSVYIKQRKGEFLLSREVRNISAEHDAQAVIVGTYARAKDNILITARMVRARDSVVLASYDYSLPIDPDINVMVPRER